MNKQILATVALTAALTLTTALAQAKEERFQYGGVQVSVRPSLMDLGQVVVFHNQHSVALRNCYFAVEGARNMNDRTYYGPIFLTDAFRPGQRLEVGWMQLEANWLPLPDDVVYLRCDNLQESKWTLSGNRQAVIRQFQATYGR